LRAPFGNEAAILEHGGGAEVVAIAHGRSSFQGQSLIQFTALRCYTHDP
jgi:hypothetical protein